MVLLTNGGADVSRAGGSGSGSISRDRVGADVGGHCLRTRYNRNIHRAAVVVGQCAIGLLLHLGPRIRLKSKAYVQRRLGSSGGRCDTTTHSFPVLFTTTFSPV